ncbi:unnamed protein product [Rhizophagus irregularis]|uniref:Uncharacterized protein n=1 Tax=Rhizophagus irregularis TaxID=588596 RepID=A0A2I1H4Y0_9GLOM|nr:hypothetical protein RhiirA4_472441 [Rhizophagus irregularis]CAB4432541.1 unnamed protein product [Rhizophagus irregularis]
MLTKKIIFEFFLAIQQSLYQTIWPQYNNNLRAWERTHNITTKNKKRVKRFTTSRSSNSTSNTVNLSPTLDSSSIPTAANSSALPCRHPFMSRTPASLGLRFRCG